MDAVGGDGDLEGALVAFLEVWTFRFFVAEGGSGVGEGDVASAEDLEAVVEVCAGSEALGAEAGTGVIEFEEIDGLGGAVADRGGDVGRAATDECDAGEKSDDAEGTHRGRVSGAVLGMGE